MYLPSDFPVVLNSSRWWSKDTVAVVTGGNRGIGFEIAKQLAQNGITTVLTSREETAGRDAVKKLVDEGLPVVYHELDVASAESAQKLADWLKRQYGAVDILVNNAGVYDVETVEGGVRTLNINFYGVKFVTKSILPLLRESEAGARIVTVSSQAGLLEPKRIRNNSVRQTLGNVDKLSEEVLDELVEGYCASLKEPEKGTWALTPYNISKALVNAYSRILAKQLDGRPAGQKVYVTPYCPGWTITDMTESTWRNNGAPPGTLWKTAAEGAADGVWLALLPASEVQSGKFYIDREVVNF